MCGEYTVTQSWFDSFTGAATVLVALWGVSTAWKGLNVWKNQSIWNADNELARKLLIATYRYRDSLYSIRHPAMSSAEMQPKPVFEVNPDRGEHERQGVRIAYANRWKSHLPKRIDLDALRLESDAVWGPKLAELLKPLLKLEDELYGFIWLYLDAHYRGDTELAKQLREHLKQSRDLTYDSMNESDVFRQDFVAGLVPIEEYLREKLGRGR